MTTSMVAAAGNLELVGLDYDEHHLKCSSTLRFSVRASRFKPDAAENARRLIAAMDLAVAARSPDGPDVEALEASFVYDAANNRFHDGPLLRGYANRHDHAADITSAHLARWLRFASRCVTGSFELSVPTVPPPVPIGSEGRSTGFVQLGEAAAVREIRELYAELPASARAEKVSLTLGDAELTVPVVGAGAFSALTDLFLSHCRLETGEDANLGRMLSSSCCPLLRRLHLEHVAGLHTLHLELAGTLEELRLDHLKDTSVLEVHASGLRSLHILFCTELSKVSVSAPALDTLGCDFGMPPDRTELTGAASVRRLEKVYLSSHGFPPESGSYCNLENAWLLEQCTATESLDVNISAPTPQMEDAGGLTELIGLLPRNPNVTDLSIDVWVTTCLGPGHRLGYSVARLVAQCGGLRRLAVAFFNQYHEPCKDPDCFCSPPAPEMEVLEQLVEAKIVGFRPVEDHVSLVRVLMAKAPALERMTVQFEYSSEEEGALPLPCDRGHWARSAAGSVRQPAYEWTPTAAAAP